ncbi:MAG TPA: metal-dependent hydrolase [Candidatus Acidoferrales bacterium]|nr:metal-dependent hydrolase [Candidatus Acidoferrales bacterium]
MLETQGNKITWLGHASFRITTAAGKVVLIDPWVSGPTCPAHLKKFDRVDTILATHGHSDHFADVPALAKRHKAKVVAIYETALWLGSKGVGNLLPMSKGGTQKVDDMAVTMVHAFHSNGIEDDGKVIYGGDPAGYVVHLPGGLCVYHAGDTALFGDMKWIGELYQPTLALLPIGDLFTMGPREAAHAIRLLGVRHVVPMHYGTFPLLTGTPEALRAEVRDLKTLELHVLKPGDTLE